MRLNEAITIGNFLRLFRAEDISPLIEIGSSTARFREVEKPHIEKYLHRPLRQRGVRIMTCDAKQGVGIDLSGDIYDDRVQSMLKSAHPKALMCCNILEHVEDRESFTKVCSALLRPNGIVVVSVPYDYPYHCDPIDTMYRPAPDEIAALFPEFEIQHKAIVSDGTYWQDLAKRGSLVGLVRVLVKMCRSLVSIDSMKRIAGGHHRLLWLFRPYRISIVVLKKR